MQSAKYSSRVGPWTRDAEIPGRRKLWIDTRSGADGRFGSAIPKPGTGGSRGSTTKKNTTAPWAVVSRLSDPLLRHWRGFPAAILRAGTVTTRGEPNGNFPTPVGAKPSTLPLPVATQNPSSNRRRRLLRLHARVRNPLPFRSPVLVPVPKVSFRTAQRRTVAKQQKQQRRLGRPAVQQVPPRMPLATTASLLLAIVVTTRTTTIYYYPRAETKVDDENFVPDGFVFETRIRSRLLSSRGWSTGSGTN